MKRRRVDLVYAQMGEPFRRGRSARHGGNALLIHVEGGVEVGGGMQATSKPVPI